MKLITNNIRLSAINLTIGVILTSALIDESNAAAIVVGNGPDTALFVVESPNVGVRQYLVNFTHDPVNNPLGASDVLQIIANNDSDFSFDLSNFGTLAQPNEFLNSITYTGVTETNDFSPGGLTWSHWVAGGQAGAAGLGIPDPQAIGDDWTLSSGLSVNFRLIEPGSSDALIFGPSGSSPTVAPIPEPSGLIFASITMVGIICRRQRPNSAPAVVEANH